MLGLRCCARAFSSCGKRGLLFVAVHGLLTVGGFSCCGARALGTRAKVVVAHGLRSCGARALERRLLWCAGLVTPQHVGSFQTRARTRVACIGRRVPNHGATGEAPAAVCWLCSQLWQEEAPRRRAVLSPGVSAPTANEWERKGLVGVCSLGPRESGALWAAGRGRCFVTPGQEVELLNPKWTCFRPCCRAFLSCQPLLAWREKS